MFLRLYVLPVLLGQEEVVPVHVVSPQLAVVIEVAPVGSPLYLISVGEADVEVFDLEARGGVARLPVILLASSSLSAGLVARLVVLLSFIALALRAAVDGPIQAPLLCNLLAFLYNIKILVLVGLDLGDLLQVEHQMLLLILYPLSPGHGRRVQLECEAFDELVLLFASLQPIFIDETRTHVELLLLLWNDRHLYICVPVSTFENLPLEVIAARFSFFIQYSPTTGSDGRHLALDVKLHLGLCRIPEVIVDHARWHDWSEVLHALPKLAT